MSLPETHIRVGVIGGGVAGSTVALRLAELGYDVRLFEEGPSLVNGPPICHLHAGGNLYREISDEQCIALLKQSIDTLRFYPHTINYRPTVIAVPKRDKGATVNLIPRLEKLQQAYSEMIAIDPANEVLGTADEYFKVYEHEDMQRLAKCECPTEPKTLDEWMIPVAKSINLDDFKRPFIMVQEYGLSLFRIAATVSMALGKAEDCQIHTGTKVVDVKLTESKTWQLTCQANENGAETYDVDYLVNACGYRTGSIDDMAGFKRQRLVEFKSAYLAHWDNFHGVWPEVIFHGLRGTPEGMGSLTPYANGYFQLHGMTEEITLFKGGLVSSSEESSQPQLCEKLSNKLTNGWEKCDIDQRTQNAIDHIAELVPSFASATVGGKPLFGAQQIPGTDPSLRVAAVSFDGENYARTEIVKLSSALDVANKIFDNLVKNGLIVDGSIEKAKSNAHSEITTALSHEEIIKMAEEIAVSRDYPKELGSDYS